MVIPLNLVPFSADPVYSVQPKYWGKWALDYLWFGLSAYLRHHPEVRYMLGPVSLSNSYPVAAKDMIVHYYYHYHGDSDYLAQANTPYLVTAERQQDTQKRSLHQ